MLVILCDGSSKGNPGPASIGVVAWDRTDNPRIICPNYRYAASIGNRTNMEAEWVALLHALIYACSKDKEQEAYIFCDSQTVVNQANGTWKIKHDNIKPLYKIFYNYKLSIPKLHINWLPRQLIYLADKAAQKGAR